MRTKQDKFMKAKIDIINTLIEAETLAGRDLLTTEQEERVFCLKLNSSPLSTLKNIQELLERDIKKIKVRQSKSLFEMIKNYLIFKWSKKR